MEPTTYVNTAVRSLLEKKVAKMQNKAAKLGMDVPSVTFGATEEYTCGSDTLGAYKGKDEEGRTVWRSLRTEVFIVGDAPKIGGYEFVAVVDLRGEKPVVRSQPYTEADLSRFYDTDCTCDHCGINRFRNDVIVVRDTETGEMMQIGRNCANDFFGTTNAASRIACSDWMEAYGNVTDQSPRAEETVSLTRLFEVAAAVVRKFGWVRHQDAKYDNTLIPTRGRVWSNLFPLPKMPEEDKVKVEKADEIEAKEVIAWIRARFLDKDPADCSEFERTVQAVVEGEGVPYVRLRNANYLIWAIAGYQRDLQKEAEERRKKEAKLKQQGESDYVGKVGERRDFSLTLKMKRAFGTEYGVTYMQKFVDADGNVVIWKGTNDTARRTVVGNAYTLKATIKAHDEYDEVKQTVVTRAKLLEGELEEE